MPASLIGEGVSIAWIRIAIPIIAPAHLGQAFPRCCPGLLGRGHDGLAAQDEPQGCRVAPDVTPRRRAKEERSPDVARSQSSLVISHRSAPGTPLSLAERARRARASTRTPAGRPQADGAHELRQPQHRAILPANRIGSCRSKRRWLGATPLIDPISAALPPAGRPPEVKEMMKQGEARSSLRTARWPSDRARTET